ncbi:MAG: hypothetical protein PHY78_04820 [Desulfobacterales bacterium]|nr:hypothetical protein [Desulfobacterales bacterium]
MKTQAQVLLLLVAMALIFCPSVYAESLTTAQIKQIEEIAMAIASQHNANSEALLDDMTVSTRAVAISRNVKFLYVLRVKKGLSPSELKEYSDELRREILPNACFQNANNPAFDRGLFYTFIYKNTYGEKLAAIVVSKENCR